MTTQSIKPQGTDLISNIKVNKTYSDMKSDSVNNFSDVMENSMNSKNNIAKNSTTKSSRNDDSKTDIKKVNSGNENMSKRIDSVKENNASENSKSVNSEDAKTQNTDDLEKKVTKVTEVLKKTVQDTLNISEEELDNMLEKLGLTMIDLLNMDNLKQLVLLANGSDDISSVLTNENLAMSIQTMMSAVDDLQLESTYQITPNELAAFIEQNKRNGSINTAQTSQLETAESSQMSNTSDTEISNMNTNQKEITIEVQKTTSTGSFDAKDSRSDTSAESKPGIDSATQMDAFINNLAISGNNDTQDFTQQITNIRQMQDITNQIVEQIKVIIKPDQAAMELQLNPENLGKINLSVVSKNGVLTAQFTAQSELVKEAIESQMQVLRENLNNQGLKVESIEVTVSNFGFEQSNQASTEEEQKNSNPQKGNRFRNDSEILGNLSEGETVPTNDLEMNGSSIDYTA